MRLAIVESPFMYRHEDPAERRLGLARNICYARLALRDCVLNGDAPIASHLLLTQPLILDDDVPAERALGIEAGLLWGRKADVTALYVDLGISSGMQHGITSAGKMARPVERHSLPGWENAIEETPWRTLERLRLFTPEQLDEIASGRSTMFGPAVRDAGYTAQAVRSDIDVDPAPAPGVPAP